METQTKRAAQTKKDLSAPAMVLTFEDLETIGRVLRKNLTDDKGAFLQAIASLVTINVEGVEVPLEPRLLMRIQTRCLDKPNWPKFLAQVVVKQLHDYAGY